MFIVLMYMNEDESLPNYLRLHRKKTGLSMRELGTLVGNSGEEQVSRHERFETLPPFVIAVAYEVVFRVPVSELFPGIRDRTEREVEQRIEALREVLELRSGRGRDAAMTARKLEWIAMRREIASPAGG